MSFILRLSVLVLLFSPAFLLAQSYKEDVDNINKRYAHMQKYTVELEYNLYPTYESSQVMESNNALMKRDEKNFYYNFLGTETLINDNYTIVIDHSAKLLLVDYSHKKGIMERDKIKGYQMDSIINSLLTLMNTAKKNDSITAIVKEKPLGGNHKQYTVACGKGDYTSLAFVFNTKSYQIEKAILYFRETIQVNEKAAVSTPRIEIVYKKMEMKPKFDKKTFSEEKYLSVLKDGKLNIKPVFSTYQVINQLITN